MSKLQNCLPILSVGHTCLNQYPLVPQGKPVITTIMARLKQGCRFPQIPDAHVTFNYVCFYSAFPPPHPHTIVALPPSARITTCPHQKLCLHVDPSIEPFKSCQEDFWQPIVTFLQLPDVAQHFKPSAVLIVLTPSTRWSQPAEYSSTLVTPFLDLTE
jgi:hypothetical protein